MAKKYGEQTFILIDGNGNELVLNAYTTDGRYNYSHHIVDAEGRNAKVSYEGRTWECYKYETALYDFVSKYYKDAERRGLESQLKAIEEKERLEVEQWAERMTNLCSCISDEGKKAVANIIDKNVDNGSMTVEGMELAITLGAIFFPK